MNAQEKAKELVDYHKASIYSIIDIERSEIPFDVYGQAAKQCALIAVDEIISIQVVKNGYWQQVKEEIEKL